MINLFCIKPISWLINEPANVLCNAPSTFCLVVIIIKFESEPL